MSNSRLSVLPADRWVGNVKKDTLRMAFFDAGGLIGVTRNTKGEIDPAQESQGWVGAYAPGTAMAKQWKEDPKLQQLYFRT